MSSSSLATHMRILSHESIVKMIPEQSWLGVGLGLGLGIGLGLGGLALTRTLTIVKTIPEQSL